MGKETFKQLIEENDAVLVDFYATWCGPCQRMHPLLEELKRHFGDRLRIVKIDVDKNGETAAAYGIQSVPTLLLFKDRNVRWRQSGLLPLNELKARIEAAL